MWSLFDTRGPGQSGYRLRTLEVYNWGTFHEGTSRQDIWRLSPDGQNSLLTGANGSGKTTLVDGLLALLVTPTKRFFNQSSGAKSNRERTEESYVEGHYGRTQSEEQQNAKIEKLRPNKADTYSIILGVFASEGAGSVPITLVQVRSFSNSGLQRKYLVVKQELNIADHIQYDSAGQWLRKLKRQFGDRIDDFDTFPKYAEHFRRLFGMRSDKALTLFNQTVGMKVLGDLDEFIRTNMLEESETEVAFKKLIDHYQTLLTAWQLLDKARTQLSLLEPVYRLNVTYQMLQQTIGDAKTHQRLLTPWFAQQHLRLCADEQHRQKQELNRLEDKLARQEQTIQDADDRRVELEVRIGNNQVEQQIKGLERDIKAYEKTKQEKEGNVRDYNRLARPLGVTENPDEAAFRDNTERVNNVQVTLAADKKRLDDNRFDARRKRVEQQNAFDLLTAEIEQLRNSVGKVTGRSAEIRQEILDAVGASEIEIPFVAEVVQVRADEKPIWNNAIEKVLHGTGLDLLVPAVHYSAVNTYINAQRDLRGKVVFHLVTGKAARPVFPDPRALVTKLDFNPQSPHADWVEQHIASRYNYICVLSQPDFERITDGKALLPSGLNRNRNRHERDDSPNHRHILGWDNRELLREKQRSARELSEDISKLEKVLAGFDKETRQNETTKTQVDQLLSLTQFSKLDWQADALLITALTRQKEQLEVSNQTHALLKEQLRELKKSIEQLGKDKDQTRDNFRDTEKHIQRLQQEQRADQHCLNTFDSDNLDADLAQLNERTHLLVDQLTYAQFEQQKGQFEHGIFAEINRLTVEHDTLGRTIRVAMKAYTSPERPIREKFPDWESDMQNLSNETDQLPEYVDRYEQIRDQNLVELEERFRNEFKSGATKALTDYCNALDIQHERICDTIDQINASLRAIKFNLAPDTYIQLERADSRQPRVRDFRFSKLNSWQPDRTQLALASDPKEAEIIHFVNRIQPFIRELQDNEKWRQDVTDVRNWSEFKAREYFMADNMPKPGGNYDSSGSLSGGEAAQLTYTVLGAAIAHQFGIHREVTLKTETKHGLVLAVVRVDGLARIKI
jgi:uncharacterized protein YPO0396